MNTAAITTMMIASWSGMTDGGGKEVSHQHQQRNRTDWQAEHRP